MNEPAPSMYPIWPVRRVGALRRRTGSPSFPGDGIGTEVVTQALRALEPLGVVAIKTTHFPWSADHYFATGETLAQAGALADLRDNYDAILFGAMGDPRVPEQIVARDVLLGLRFGLDLYINLRPVQLIDERLCPIKGKRPADINFYRPARKHRGAVRPDGRLVQARHPRRGRDQRRPQHPPRGRAHHSRRLRAGPYSPTAAPTVRRGSA